MKDGREARRIRTHHRMARLSNRPHHKGPTARSNRRRQRRRRQGGWLLSHLHELGRKGPAEQRSGKATEESGAGKGEGLLIGGEVLPTLQQATRVIVTQGLPSLPEGLKVHAEATQELSAGVSLRREGSIQATRVGGVRLMRAAGCLTKKSSSGLGGLSCRHCGRPLTTFSSSSTGLRGRSLMSAAQCCRLGGGTLGLQRLMPPCSAT